MSTTWSTEGTFTWTANQLLSDRDHAAQMYGFDQIEQGRVVDAYLDMVWNTQTQSYETVYIDGSAQALYDAVKQDFAEGTIGVRYLLEDSQERLDNTCVTDLYFTWRSQTGRLRPRNRRTVRLELRLVHHPHPQRLPHPGPAPGAGGPG